MSKKITACGMAGKSKGRVSHWGNLNSEVKKMSKKARRVEGKNEIRKVKISKVIYNVVSEIPNIPDSRYILDEYKDKNDAISDAEYWNCRTGDNRLIYPLSNRGCIVYVEEIEK